MTQRQNIFGFILLSAIFVGWLVYSESKSSDSENHTADNGPKDSDGDGILDEKDKCPTEAGEINFFGCPDGDTDGDGLNDKMEAKEGTDPKNMDTDGDGVNDKNDICPKEKGTKAMKGCPEKKVEPTPIVNVDENTLVAISYKGSIYNIKRGFVSVKGMTFNASNWRFYKDQWQRQDDDNPNGPWRLAKNEDVNFLLAKLAKKKNASGGNGASKPLEPKSPSIPLTHKDLLRRKHDGILKDGFVSSDEQREWSKLLNEKYSNGDYKKDLQIESWNDEIIQ